MPSVLNAQNVKIITMMFYLTYWWDSRPRHHPQSLLRHLGTGQTGHRKEEPLEEFHLNNTDENINV